MWEWEWQAGVAGGSESRNRNIRQAIYKTVKLMAVYSTTTCFSASASILDETCIWDCTLNAGWQS